MAGHRRGANLQQSSLKAVLMRRKPWKMGVETIDPALESDVLLVRDGRDARRSACRAAVFNEDRKEQDDFHAAAGATSGASSTVRKLSTGCRPVRTELCWSSQP